MPYVYLTKRHLQFDREAYWSLKPASRNYIYNNCILCRQSSYFSILTKTQFIPQTTLIGRTNRQADAKKAARMYTLRTAFHLHCKVSNIYLIILGVTFLLEIKHDLVDGKHVKYKVASSQTEGVALSHFI